MTLVVGLGNPGSSYRYTRHNAGARVVATLASELGLRFRQEHRALVAEHRDGDTRVFYALPQTYMNDSGLSVGQLVNYLPVEGVDQLLVVHDEIDLVLGELRFKRGGGTAGHNGLRSIVDHLGSDAFARLRVGVGRPEPGSDVPQYVLGVPPRDEREVLAVSESEGARAVSLWTKEGDEAVMRLYNRKARSAE